MGARIEGEEHILKNMILGLLFHPSPSSASGVGLYLF